MPCSLRGLSRESHEDVEHREQLRDVGEGKIWVVRPKRLHDRENQPRAAEYGKAQQRHHRASLPHVRPFRHECVLGRHILTGEGGLPRVRL